MLRGGLSIAAGSDGCVFDGTFAGDGTFTKSADKVTKVYAPRRADVATNEWAAMKLVKDVTGGQGVVVAEGPPSTIATIPESAFEGGDDKSTCKELMDLTPPHDPMSGLVLPRITGTLFELYIDALRNNKKLILPAESFPLIHTAVGKMSDAGIVHMDFALRNVFYKEEGGNKILLLGDFGNTFQLGDDIDERIKAYIARYNLGGAGKFLACTKIDGVHPLATALMILYNAFLSGEAEYEAILKNIRDNNFVDRTTQIAEAAWVSKYLRSLVSRDPSVKPAVDDFMNVFAAKLKTVIGIFAAPGRGYAEARDAKVGIQGILLKTLKRSDKCLLDIMTLMYQKDALTLESVKKLTDAWFPPPPAPKKGGKKPELPEEVATLEEALARKDPELGDSSPSIADGITQLGGGRQPMKTRRNRVKMSRRR